MLLEELLLLFICLSGWIDGWFRSGLSFYCLFVCFEFEKGSLYLAQAGLNPLRAFCLCFPHAKSPGEQHRVQLRGEV